MRYNALVNIVNRRPAQEPSPSLTDPGQISLAEIDHTVSLRDVPEEVTKAPLEIYSDAALQGRLAHYEREALLERDAAKRGVWKAEAGRTRNEINRRRLLKQAEAEKVFSR